VRSIKSECLAQIIPIGERYLRYTVTEYTEHYHHERKHQGLDDELIDRRTKNYSGGRTIECRENLGGLIRHYRRAA